MCVLISSPKLVLFFPCVSVFVVFLIFCLFQFFVAVDVVLRILLCSLFLKESIVSVAMLMLFPLVCALLAMSSRARILLLSTPMCDVDAQRT